VQINFGLICLVFLSLNLSLVLKNSFVFANESTGTIITPETALEHFNSKRFDDAADEWKSLLHSPKYKNSPEILFNLSLAEFKLNQFGDSLGHIRAAQNQKPFSLRIYKTLNHILTTLEQKEFYSPLHESVLKVILIGLPGLFWFLLSIVTLAIGYFYAMRNAPQDLTLKQFIKPYAISVLASVIPLSFLFLKYKIESETFATLSGTSATLIYSSPDPNSPEVGTLKSGDAFQVLSVKKTRFEDSLGPWISISTSETPYGWIQTKNFIIHRGKIDPLALKN
jgi:hypothetical protein